eukprot:INCI6549.2.p1 GENE.INCI6549.2~~INCI6549.2.p1  ORF type:complete len:368 (-),score=37.68 INCI6549.2:982-2085(-)
MRSAPRARAARVLEPGTTTPLVNSSRSAPFLTKLPQQDLKPEITTKTRRGRCSWSLWRIIRSARLIWTSFFSDAATGNLPAFAWINPRSGVNVTTGEGSNDQHPDHDVALGEQLMKDIYEALRASPQWNETLFIITMDEHGGFWDHVPPPSGVPPPNATMLPSYPDSDFFFDRLGVRIPTLLISPWIAKGTVVSAPPEAQKPANNSEYDLTSIIATTRILLNMSAEPLTDRDAWAATFEHTLATLDAPRSDCPVHLPDAPPPSLDHHIEAALPINDLQRDISFMHAHLAGVAGDADHVTNTHSAVPTTQGEISEWMQQQFAVHAASARYNVSCDVNRRVAGWKEDKCVRKTVYQSSAPCLVVQGLSQ